MEQSIILNSNKSILWLSLFSLTLCSALISSFCFACDIEFANAINLASLAVFCAVAFAIADGQLPSNTGAGYVIRRILRRAIRYGFTFLNTKEPFIYKLVNTLSKQMGDYFPELIAQKQLIKNVIKEEESSFLRTLDQGLVLLDGIIKNTEGNEVSGKKAFELFDTYGFPIDLTALILSEKGMTLNEKAFAEALEVQKTRSRAAAVVETDDWVILYDDDIEEFIGYDTLEAKVKITLLKTNKLYKLKY